MTKHKYYECDGKCGEDHCNFCDGGLALCTVCNQFEGALPTECPGEKISAQTGDMIYAGKADYINGRWVTL